MERVIAQIKDRPKNALFELQPKLAKAVGLLGVLNIIATLPQVVEIWVNQNTAGVSIITWAYYAFFATVLFLYAVSIRQWPLTITYFGSSLLYYMVLVGAIIFN